MGWFKLYCFNKNECSYLTSTLTPRYEQWNVRAVACTVSTKGSYFTLLSDEGMAAGSWTSLSRSALRLFPRPIWHIYICNGVSGGIGEGTSLRSERVCVYLSHLHPGRKYSHLVVKFSWTYHWAITVGGIVQPATFVELRFCEFAPESRAFWGVKKLRKWRREIWSYLGLFHQCIDWSDQTIQHMKDKTRQFICNSFHLSKVNASFIGLVGTAESRKFLGAQHTSKEFSHKKTSFCDFWDFFICCWQHFGLYAQKVPSYS